MNKYTLNLVSMILVLLFFIGNSENHPFLLMVGLITFFVYIIYTEISAHVFRKLKSDVIKNLLIVTFWYLYIAIIGILFSTEGMSIATAIILVMFVISLYKNYKGKFLKKNLEQKFRVDSNSPIVEINDSKFNDKILQIYKELQNAYITQDIDSIKDIISEDMYIKHKSEIERLKFNKLKKITEDIKLVNSKIISTYNMFEEEIEVLFEVTYRQYYIDEQKKAIVGGDETLTHTEIYQLTFIRKRDCICVNCKTKLDKDIDVCPNCKNKITHENSKYILAKEQTMYKDSEY